MSEKRKAEIISILAEIKRLDRETNGQFRQAEDREALDIVSRMERKIRKDDWQPIGAAAAGIVDRLNNGD